ncbi:TPA: MFS transporter [Salmonella enterica subsp. enterica serovar Weltevreden]
MMKSPSSPGRAGLTLLLAGQLMPSIDTSITNVALDSITRSLNASVTQLELIVALYSVALAIFLAPSSRLGDNAGRRRLFLIGVAIFGGASLACGLAQTVNQLLIARVVQGAGAALIIPQILATVHITLEGAAHVRAISLVGGIGGIAFIIGQMGGGWLVSADIAGLGWRNAFFINIPVCLIVLLFGRRYIPETRSDTPSRIDWQGAGLLALALGCLLFSISLGPELHWPWVMQLMLLAVLPLLYGMYRNALRQQLQERQPLLPPRLLQLPGVSFSILAGLLFFSAWSGFLFCMALMMQSGLGMVPQQAGDSFIASGVAYFIAALYVPRLTTRYQQRTILLAGLSIQITGLLILIIMLHILGSHTGMLALSIATSTICTGQAFIVNSFYRIGIRNIPAGDAGAGSAVLSTILQASMGIGPVLPGGVFLYFLAGNHGNYPQAMTGFLTVEIIMMLTLMVVTLFSRRTLVAVPG